MGMTLGAMAFRKLPRMNDDEPPRDACDSSDPCDSLLDRRLIGEIIGALYTVYATLRFGLLESVYVGALQYELELRGVTAEREAAVDVWYKGRRVGVFRADLLVERRVVVEVKASDSLADAARNQLRTYLRASDLEVGLLLHFGPTPSFHRVLLTNDRKPYRRNDPTRTMKSVNTDEDGHSTD